MSVRGVAALPALLLTACAAAWADSSTATLTLEGNGQAVSARFTGPAAYLVGFARAPRSDAERDTLALAVANLRTGDALVRLSTQAGCRQVEARVDADPAAAGQKPGDLGATWRFECDFPDRLDSAALGVFMGFPALDRVHVRYTLGPVRGESVLTPTNPVVTFVPLY